MEDNKECKIKLVRENVLLDSKIQRLKQFLETDKYKLFPFSQKVIINLQYVGMKIYSYFLKKRKVID